MNKNDLIAVVADSADLSKADAARAVDKRCIGTRRIVFNAYSDFSVRWSELVSVPKKQSVQHVINDFSL